MKTADLYIRVSTDEQADKGYSQRSQEELLSRYCDINKINIRKVIFEDHSAKTFNRPEWQKYLHDLRKHKSQTDLVLFLKWDRFSRNAGDAYQMINILRKLGVEPQAIEQPLDLSIPENKMMLAFYLAAPEVENDRRALNILHGMRRARKEGRYMGLAPIGFANKIDDGGRKYIAPKLPEADIIRWSFETIAEAIYNTEQVYKMARQKGFKGTKSLFWFVIRNPVYSGKIFIPKYKDEESRFVKGQHEPIISEALYYKVQDVLDGKKRGQYRLKVASNETMPLRGFLICPDCGKLLTGSASKGRYKYYSYYHCVDGCTCRFRTEQVNELFVFELKKYIPNVEMLNIYKLVLTEAWNDQTNHLQNDRKQLLAQIKELEEKLSYLRELLSSKQLDPEDFREMKTDYSSKLEKLETKLSACNDDQISIDNLLDRGLNNLLKLDNIYEAGDIEKKREVIGSIYPEKLTFDRFELRTTHVNEAVHLIYMINNELGANKNRTDLKKSNLSCQVEMRGFEPPASTSLT
ncbi:MAG: recombinase family protein [Cytophagales bacterium]|nr:recombinase family protein [Cytophagales bacterium]